MKTLYIHSVEILPLEFICCLVMTCCDVGFFLEPQNQMESAIVFMTCVLLTSFTLLPNGF